MNHSWQKSSENPLKCIHCARGFIDHQVYATCDFCGSIGSCNIFGNIKNLRAPLLCTTCEKVERDKNSEVLDRTKILADAARIDDSIQYNGDFFNAETVALVEIKRAIDAEEGLDEQQKKYKYMEQVAARYTKFSKVLFQLEKKADQVKIAKLTMAKSLRSFGDDYRKEYREQIAQADANYIPPSAKPKAKPKMKIDVKPIEKKSAIDRLIDGWIMASDNPNMTREQALEEIRKFRKE